MPGSDACSFRSKWEDENGETAMLLLSADRSAAPQCLSPIARSWERCRQLGLVRAHTASLQLLADRELTRRKEQHRVLVQLAANEVSIMRRALTGADGVALLAGPDGTILDGCGDSGFLERAQRVALRPGPPGPKAAKARTRLERHWKKCGLFRSWAISIFSKRIAS